MLHNESSGLGELRVKGSRHTKHHKEKVDLKTEENVVLRMGCLRRICSCLCLSALANALVLLHLAGARWYGQPHSTVEA